MARAVAKKQPQYVLRKGGLNDTSRLIRMEIVCKHEDYLMIIREAEEALGGMCSGDGRVVSNAVLDMPYSKAVEVVRHNASKVVNDWQE